MMNKRQQQFAAIPGGELLLPLQADVVYTPA